MKADRYYYSQLDPKEQDIYRNIYAAMINERSSVAVKLSLTDCVDIQRIICAIDYDNPNLFYVNFSTVKYAKTPLLLTVLLSYYFSHKDILTLQQEVEKKLTMLTKKVQGVCTYDLICSAHDLIVRNVLYDQAALVNLQKMTMRSNTVLGVLFHKTAVCEGIAKTYKMLLNRLQIPCIVVIGRTREPGTASAGDILHAWNIVRCDTMNFAVDVTWDINASTKKLLRHDYLNLSDALLSRDHTAISQVPKCHTDNEDYLTRNGLCASDEASIYALVAAQIKSGKQSIEFRYVGACVNQGAVSDAVLRAVNDHVGTQTVSCSINVNQNIFGYAW